MPSNTAQAVVGANERLGFDSWQVRFDNSPMTFDAGLPREYKRRSAAPLVHVKEVCEPGVFGLLDLLTGAATPEMEK